ncbi:hypothetical protein [Halorussus halobius]|uniref:hypothetical protein n=1 Tax=Halorussus halobius TaxID=1710537 RepID=UPI0010929350|nr:hypothetical protein [Halorussus halobius]
MAVETDRREVADLPLDGTDEFFGVLVGLYAAVLVAPTAVAAVALGVTTDGATLYPVLLASVAATVAVVGYLARSERLAVGLGSTPWVWLGTVVPAGYAVALVVAIPNGGVPGSVLAVSMLAALGGVFVGMGLAVAARNRHAKAVVSAAEEYARFEARGPERDRRVARWAVAGLMVGGMVGFAASVLVPELEAFRWLFNVAVAGGAGLTGALAERTVAVTDAGLLTGNPVAKHLRPWSAFESYEVTDDAVVVHRAGWSAWGLRDVRRDRDDVADVEAVAAALDRALPPREA